ncbi:MAG: T9SS type A sorting domain-containing protein [Moheibacter sp.]
MTHIYFSKKLKPLLLSLFLLGGLSYAQVWQLTDGNDIVNATDVSNDGVVVLSSMSSNFIWSEADGLTVLNMMTNGTELAGSPKISDDGMRIAASAVNPESDYTEMAIYDVSTEQWTYLGGIGSAVDNHLSTAWGLSGDGETVVGLGWLSTLEAHAIKWTETDGLVNMGTTVADRSTRANDASFDGSKIVGWQDAVSGYRQAAIWVDGVQTILTDGGTPLTEAIAISNDGNWVVGGRYNYLPWIWNESEGVTSITHPDAGQFFRGGAMAISGDGSMVVGYFRAWPGGPYFGEGFIWTKEAGRINLNEYVESLGLDDLGITFSLPSGISSDGKYITGTGFIEAENKIVAFLIKTPSTEGCLEAEGQWPTETFEPPCYGAPALITEVGWAGEYSVVSVVEGMEYIFSSSVTTDFITIGNTDGTEVLTVGTGSVTWISTVTGEIRFYNHLDENCGTEMVERSRFVQCGEPFTFEDPDFDCFQGDGGISGVENGMGVNPENQFRVADNFVVEPEIEFTVQQIIINVVSGSEVSEAIINFREDSSGLPGDIIETVTVSPTSATSFATTYGLNVYRVVFDFVTPITFAEGTYWIEPTMINFGGSTVYWEQTTLGSHESFTANSSDHAETWSINSENYNSVFYIGGECNELGLGDLSSFDFSYYPNPVQDELNLTSKKSIESVSVYNLAGQQVLSSSKVANGQLNLSMLPTGTYVFKVVLEGGQVETFKIIKK